MLMLRQRPPLVITIKIVTSIFTIYALFGDDIRVSSTSHTADPTFDVLTSISLFIFTVEVLAASIGKDDYLWSFFFFLDVLSTASLILDLTFVAEALFSGGDSSTGEARVARAGRASRAGTKAGRVVRIIRLIRLLRIIKLYKAALGRKNKQEKLRRASVLSLESADSSGVKSDERRRSSDGDVLSVEENEGSDDQSRVGKKLSELTTRKVILLVLAMLFLIPQFEVTGHFQEMESSPHSSELKIGGVVVLDTGNIPTYTYDKLISSWNYRCGNSSGILLDFEDDDEKHCPDIYLRFTERVRYVPLIRVDANEEKENTTQFNFEIVMDQRSYTKASAILSIIQTIFVCFLLGGGAMLFSKDANDLVLRPIERMASKMDKLRFISKPLHVKRVKLRCSHFRGEPLETVVLEKTIIKIGGLLAVGFGEAGTEIIGHNIRGGSAAVDPMVAGSRVEAIIGFCDIRQFNIATEVLQDKIMIFVNQIGEIVHGIVDEYHGSANRNLGEAFLMIWRLPCAESEEENAKVKKKREKLADMAVMSFVKILVAINKSPVLAEYRHHPGLSERVEGEYRVTMGFGMHVGWAIEGAIGSEFKIDASYLSPNVNTASRLAAATKQYRTNILCSEALMKGMCSEGMEKYSRVIDNVTVKGSEVPVRLHTIDVDYKALEVADAESWDMRHVLKKKTKRSTMRRRGSLSDRLINKSKLRRMREKVKARKWQDKYVIADAWVKDEDLVSVRKIFTEEFLRKFGEAYKNYESGKWESTAEILSEIKDTLGYEDGPSAVLLEFIKSYGCIPPKDWKGYRALTQK
ncbi:conserved hypothetical protein [Perkinsus marinus ATCC 50983]|uniref:Guanylate cyclase domain-containing protein n=1 Tax=Perkinsus marinus (strain ATCC 50983 / TXsc) TaxID=423536 RepID=C5LC38_PERM5|nr:conserved hypothetical protein [Perkinsus marinus ATCC 50983]EER05521.1 conserved hypothetical protein [Perkinsus marinus ATCC 50983]|eukprot:XP_002773705.1 conserved hypothetical protein [Perkinsus marinus ATCC 50983]